MATFTQTESAPVEQVDEQVDEQVAVKLNSGKNAIVVFDLEETKTHHEIVGWHFANEKGLANLQKQAVREGGQILDMRNNSQSPSDQTGTDTTNTIPPSAEKSSADSKKIIDKITSAKAGSKARQQAFLDLPDGEHTVNGKTITKSDNVFTLDGKKLAARDIEKATRTLNEKLKGSEQTYTPQTETVSEKSDQSGNTILFSKPGDLETPAHIVEVPELEIDVNNTEAVKQYLKDHILGKNIYIKHDGRPVAFYSPSLRAVLKRKNEHRHAFPAVDTIIEESYPVGYEAVDQEHKKKRPDLKGQFIYAALVNMMNKKGKRENYIVTIKLDDSHADKKAQFKDISVKKRSLYVGQTQNSNSVNVNPPADRILTIQQIVDFVKNDYVRRRKKLGVLSGKS